MPWATGSTATAKMPPPRSPSIGGGGQWVSPGSTPMTAVPSMPVDMPVQPEAPTQVGDADVVAAVKELQRTDPAAREQWRLYCENQGGGVRDPNKHPTQFLQVFLSEFHAGIRPEISSQQASSLVDFVKEGQRKSAHWKQAWSLYCQSYGAGINDPSKHNQQFLVAFLDFLGQNGVAAFGSAPPTPGADPTGTVPGADAAERLLKRPRTTAPGMPVPGLFPGVMPMPMPVVGVSTGDLEKDALVMRVKAFQRSGDAQRQLWSDYCDERLNGKRDPVKHDKIILETFLAINQPVATQVT
mmetsp:Transcript_70333/g.205703  ORF Transcript_70333/g.205703 Transcript_70333/m.205703 type:complete len:298 (+) Transcript_70333:60-953(+)